MYSTICLATMLMLQHPQYLYNFPFLQYCFLVWVAVSSTSLECLCILTGADAVVPPRTHLQFSVYHGSLTSIKPFQQKWHVLDVAALASNSLAAAQGPYGASRNLPKLHSELVTLAEPFGQYFAKLQIGTPTTDIAVTIDTGSPLMWLQCQPCQQCGKQAKGYPIFDPAKSSSYRNLMCDSDICQARNKSVPTGCTSSGICKYNVTYGDKSNSSGYLAQETFTFATASNSALASTAASKDASYFAISQFVFGCGFDNVGVEAQYNASGLMGLDRGVYSIVSQLNIDVFSYCLPNRVSNVDVSGYLTFGKGAANNIDSSSNPSLQYTPMIQNNHSTFVSQFYYLGLTGVSINSTLLEIPAAALEINTKTGLGGTIIDSGTTLTAFIDEAYVVIVQAIESYIGTSYKKFDLEGRSTMLCYKVPLWKQRGAPPAAPKVTLHFAGSVEVELGTDHIFVKVDSDMTNNYYCLAFRSGGPLISGASNFIGNYQQQDFLVEYDLANSRVGFAPSHCNNAGLSFLLTLSNPILYSKLSFPFIMLLLLL